MARSLPSHLLLRSRFLRTAERSYPLSTDGYDKLIDAFAARNAKHALHAGTADHDADPAQHPRHDHAARAADEITFGSFNGAGNVSWRATRTTALALYGGYAFGGALNADARAIIPQQYGPRAGASMSTTLSRYDAIVTSVSGQETVTIAPCETLQTSAPPGALCREEVPTASAMESLLHKLSRTATLSVGAGVGRVGRGNAGPERARDRRPSRYRSRDAGPHGRTYLLSAAISPTVDFAPACRATASSRTQAFRSGSRRRWH